MIIVSDTSVITNLLQIGKIEILPAIFGKILVPVAVWDELAILEPQRRALLRFDWLEIKQAKDRQQVTLLCETLDLGESEAIVLAIEIHADYLLMDERKGREKAKNLGIQVTGLLGVLFQAKAIGIFPSIKPIMDELLTKTGFRLHKSLYEEALRIAGE